MLEKNIGDGPAGGAREGPAPLRHVREGAGGPRRRAGAGRLLDKDFVESEIGKNNPMTSWTNNGNKTKQN